MLGFEDAPFAEVCLGGTITAILDEAKMHPIPQIELQSELQRFMASAGNPCSKATIRSPCPLLADF